ncbi:MAG: hypothetical protein V7606_2886 [Burkholderiales bacterium]
MDVLLIELLLWCGLLFLFWALKDGLGQVESEMESFGLLGSPQVAGAAGRARYVHPEKLTEPIGSYKDAPIYRYATIDGRRYQFDRVTPAIASEVLNEEERCMEPGLVYVRCDA